jgi:hypothetical protein
MSSTGFFHSRFSGTLADAGCWAFMLGVFVIHPPKETQPQTEIDLLAAHGAVAVGTYDAGLPLHSLPGTASFLFAAQSGPCRHERLHGKHRAYTIVRAIRGTVNSILCETSSRVTSTITVL